MTGLLTSETSEEKAYFDNRGAVPETQPENVPDREQRAPETPVETTNVPDREQTTEPEKPAEPAKEADKEPDLRTVPYVALKEERQKRQKEREERLKLEGRLSVIEQEWRRQPAPEKPKELDPLARLERADKFIEQTERQQQHDAQRRQIVVQYEASAREFEKETPDFRAAYDYAVDHRLNELMLMGHDAATAQQILADNELAIVALAMQSGRSPAEIIYAQAKHRGYTAKKAEPAPKEPETAAQKLATVSQGQQASKSLSQAPGAPAKPGSLESLLNLSDEEFDAATRGKKWEKLWK